MSNQIKLPSDSLKYLMPQRTDYRGKSPDEIAAAYESEIADYASTLNKVFPPIGKRMRILDIGCGLGIGLLATRKLYGPDNTFVGLDKNEFAENIHFGYTNEAAAYNSISLTEQVLALNGIPNAKIIDVASDGFPARRRFDLVISLIAWGFHFPARTYAQQVHKALVPGGKLVIDLRTLRDRSTGVERDAGGLAELTPYFKLVEQQPGRKFTRSFFEKL